MATKKRSYPTVQTTYNRPVLVYLREDQLTALAARTGPGGSRSAEIRRAVDRHLKTRPKTP